MKELVKIDISKLEQARLEKGWSIRKLEKESNVSRFTIFRINKGKNAVEKYTLSKLAKALGRNIDYLKGK